MSRGTSLYFRTIRNEFAGYLWTAGLSVAAVAGLVALASGGLMLWSVLSSVAAPADLTDALYRAQPWAVAAAFMLALVLAVVSSKGFKGGLEDILSGRQEAFAPAYLGAADSQALVETLVDRLKEYQSRLLLRSIALFATFVAFVGLGAFGGWQYLHNETSGWAMALVAAIGLSSGSALLAGTLHRAWSEIARTAIVIKLISNASEDLVDGVVQKLTEQRSLPPI